MIGKGKKYYVKDWTKGKNKNPSDAKKMRQKEKDDTEMISEWRKYTAKDWEK